MATTLQDIPEIGLKFQQSRMISEALDFSREHCNITTYNHAVRAAYWAAIIVKKHPAFADGSVDLEGVIVSCILHDMGWAETKSLLSQDKRFEVDGANITRDFISASKSRDAEQDAAWSRDRIQRCWDAVALHTTFSIAKHAAPEVALTAFGVLSDFMGPAFPNGPGGDNLITVEEYAAVTKVLPRGEFNSAGIKKVLCGLCRDKPATTYDNFVGLFGSKFGTDGLGTDKEAFSQASEKSQVIHLMLSGLDALQALDTQLQ